MIARPLMHRAVARSVLAASLAFASIARAQAPAPLPRPKAPPAPRPDDQVAVDKASPKPPAPPTPAPELAQLQLFAGTWHCEGKSEASLYGPAHPVKSELVAKMEPDKFWLQIHYAEKKTPENPKGGESDEHWGFDSGGGKFLRIFVDGDGGWGTANSPGWEGDRLVWTGDYNSGGQKTEFRQTFLKKSDKELSDTFEMQLTGEWKTLGTDECKKAAK